MTHTAADDFTIESTKPYKIAVVGGGIGGLILTLALLQHRVPVVLYEAAPKFGEIGAGVSFGPNAIRAMKLISPHIYEAFEKRCTHNQWDEKKNVWFDFRYGEGCGGRYSVGQKITELIGEGGQASVHRAHFLDELVKLLPDAIAKFGKRVLNYSDSEEGVVLRFEDGTEATHDAVVGCDGIKSRIRLGLLGNDHPAAKAMYSGKYAYRGLIPMEEASKLLGDELAKNGQMYLGRHGHMLTFGVERGKTMNVVAFSSSETWDHTDWIVNARREDMFADFSGWGSSVREILSLMKKSDVWALFNHPPAPTYYRGRVALLGDAAHASTPHIGAGAGMAIEDAYILSNLLAKVQSKEEITQALMAYDAVRRPRSTKLVEKSREQGQLYEMELVGYDLKNLKSKLDESTLWVWNHDLTEDLAQAQELYAR